MCKICNIRFTVTVTLKNNKKLHQYHNRNIIKSKINHNNVIKNK